VYAYISESTRSIHVFQLNVYILHKLAPLPLISNALVFTTTNSRHTWLTSSLNVSRSQCNWRRQ